MTFSIVARCPRTGEFGISAITALPAVGKFLTHAAPGAGAVATQARLNPYLGIDGIRLLQTGMSASDTIEALKQTDPRMDRRQLGVVDRERKDVDLDWRELQGMGGRRDEAGFLRARQSPRRSAGRRLQRESLRRNG